MLIEDSNPQAKQFVKYSHTLPSVPTVNEPAMSFAQAAKECNAISVDEFIDELKECVRQRYRNAKS